MEYSLGALEDEVNKETRATALKILRGLTFATPVDTGRAKGSWQTSTGTPKTGQTTRLDKTKSGAPTFKAESQAIANAKTIKYPEIWIANNLPYIGVLNTGTSEQAPAKFVESVIQKVVNRNG